MTPGFDRLKIVGALGLIVAVSYLSHSATQEILNILSVMGICHKPVLKPHSFKILFNVVYYLCLHLFPSGFPNKIVHIVLFFMLSTCPAHHTLLY
jgi:hypothetical protein